MNNLDIFILIIVLISGLIALNRGLIKEVLSIIGWMLSVVAIVTLLPIVQPLVQNFAQGDTFSLVVSAILILIVFFIIWIIITSQIIDKIRSSKLSAIDRILGLFFGIVRAWILIILFNILVGWVMTPDEQPQVMKESKYFQMAGDFAEPVEKLLPKDLIEGAQKENEKKSEEKEHEKVLSEDMDKLFDKLVQPKVESKKNKDSVSKNKKNEGYNKSEQKSLDRLIEMTVE
ncbi:MAG: CvpA family protein [Azospirillum sp.]|nr:CvpA family protein [Azospirillum sp.]